MIIILFGLLLGIIYQDFKDRAIDLWLILSFVGFSAIYTFTQHSFDIIGISILLNFFFVFIQLLIIQIAYILKERKWEFVMDKALGWGDIVFWLGSIFLFAFTQYVLYFILSIVFTFLLNKVIFKNDNEIPLAGGQALVLFFILLLTVFLPEYSMYDENLFLKLIQY